jgi:hypothetical protein
VAQTKWLLVLALWCSPCLAVAETDNSPAGASEAQIQDALPTVKPSGKPVQSPEIVIRNLRRAVDELQADNDRLRANASGPQQVYAKYYYEEFLRKRAEIQLDGFYWQRRTSEILVWIVVTVCLSGIIFSGFQLWRSLNSAGLHHHNGSREPDLPLDTTIDISLQRFKLTSSVVGLAVLLISVAYLFLFLTHVYKINIIDDVAPAREQGPS